MTAYQRRHLLRVCAALTVVSSARCARPVDRATVLRALVREVVTPDVSTLQSHCRALTAATQRFTQDPHGETLASVRTALKVAIVSWKRAYTFRNGPIVETNALLRAMFWPSRPKAIESALQSAASPPAGWLEELGVDGKGVFAMEFLLFEVGKSEQQIVERFAGPGGEKPRQYLNAVAANVSGYADQVAARIAGTAYADRFAAGGQDSVNRLVNQMVDTVETLVTARLGRVREFHTSQLLRPSEVEGWPSGTSHEIALALLAGTERLFVGAGGGGLADLVKAVAPKIEQRVRSAFRSASSSVSQLRGPLERVVRDRPAALDQAITSVRELEVALKADAASALGVTLTFSAGDGD